MAKPVMSDFYVYVLFRPNGVPCYVGKGRGPRWKRRDRHIRNPHIDNIIQNAGGDLPALKVREGLLEQDALDTERALIKAIGREVDGGPLVNMTDGGMGTAGSKMTPEWCAHRSKMATEFWSSQERRDEFAAKMKGNQYSKKPHTLSEEWRLELTEKMKGNTFTLGMKASPEAREKMSAASKGRPKSPEHKAKMAAAHRGKTRPRGSS